MSYLDLLPAEENPTPRGNPHHKKTIGIKEHACAKCGKKFFLGADARGWMRFFRGDELRYCTWSCLRADEREREALGKEGYRAVVCRGWEEAQKMIMTYLETKGRDT